MLRGTGRRVARSVTPMMRATPFILAREIHRPAKDQIPDIDPGRALARFMHETAAKQDGAFEAKSALCQQLNTRVGSLLKGDGHLGEAEVAARAAHLAACDPEVQRLHLLSAQRNLMLVLASGAAMSNSDAARAEAIELGKEALAVARRTVGAYHPLSVSLLREFSTIVLDYGEAEEAEPVLREAADGCQALFGDVHEETFQARALLSNLLATRGKYAQAAPVLRANLHASRMLHGDASPRTLLISSDLAALYLEQCQYEQAEHLLAWHAKATERAYGRDSLQSRAALLRLAECKAAAGDEACARSLALGLEHQGVAPAAQAVGGA